MAKFVSMSEVWTLWSCKTYAYIVIEILSQSSTGVFVYFFSKFMQRSRVGVFVLCYLPGFTSCALLAKTFDLTRFIKWAWWSMNYTWVKDLGWSSPSLLPELGLSNFGFGQNDLELVGVLIENIENLSSIVFRLHGYAIEYSLKFLISLVRQKNILYTLNRHIKPCS